MSEYSVDNVSDNENLIKDNYKIMQLSAPSISIQTKSKINATFDNYVPEYNKTSMLSKMIKEFLDLTRHSLP